MVDAHDPNGGDDELAPRHVLEALVVPELPYDFTDRVMGSLQPAPLPRLLAPSPALPWIVAGCSGAVAVAATLMAVVLWNQPEMVPITHVMAPVAAPAPAAISVALPPVAATPAPQLGHLVLAVEPKGAIVRVDGAQLVGPSPFVATNLVPGHHAIAIEHDGFDPWTRELDLPVGELSLMIELAPRFEPPSLDPLSPKAPVRRIIGGPGSPDLKNPFAASGDDPLAGDDPPGPSSPGMKDPFSAPPTGKSILRIGTNPGTGPASVFVDGKLVGSTPIGKLRVSAGHHKVKWKWSDGREITMAVDVPAGESKLIKAG